MFKKIMVAILSLAMMFTTNMNFASAQTQQTKKRVVFSIDAGRKYFSKDQLLQIVDKAYANGYSDVQLILGNDGLRFNLDDMSLTVNGTTYTSDDVKAAIKAGNDKYYADPNGNALTETEMNEILARAKKYGINIIPLINTPGHMDAILVAMEQLGLSDVRFTNGGKKSERTVNLRNDQAIAFCKELVKKYVTYFASKGASDIFNFGSDEYANDVFTNPGWGEIQNNGIYPKFVTYVNDLCKIIKDAGMKPMCFNDGIYYNRKTNFGTFDTDLIISYWTAGWWGFNVAKPEFIAGKGHQILNTNDGWYWVLGRVNSGSYNFTGATNGINNNDFNDVPGSTSPTSVNTIGSMQCVWCDEPSKAHDMDRIMQLMDKFSEKHANVMERPANYTKVHEAIAKVPTDLKDYTETSVQALNTALNAVNYTLRVSEQAKVDKMATDIEAAVTALKLKTADYAKVDAAIKKAEALTKTNYVDFTPVETAINAVKRDLPITKQAEVDAYATAIEEAIASLKLKTADYAKVDAAIKKAEALTKTNYVDFTPVETAINAVKRDLPITKQAEVDAYATAIEEAIASLKLKTADYAKVDAAIKKAEALTKTNYVDFTPVETAINAVKRDLPITKQAEVDAYATAIEEAIANLKKVEVVKPMEPSKPNTDKPSTNKPNVDSTNTGDVTNFASVVSVAGVAAIGVYLSVKARKEE